MHTYVLDSLPMPVIRRYRTKVTPLAYQPASRERGILFFADDDRLPGVETIALQLASQGYELRSQSYLPNARIVRIVYARAR